MLNRLLLASILLFGIATAHKLNAPNLSVIDGDTLRHGNQRLRLACVDAPEMAQPYGLSAAALLEALAITRYEIKDIDRYGRQVVIAYAGDTTVQELLLDSGLAWYLHAYRSSCAEYVDTFQAAELRARREARGLWADPNPIPPSDFRRAATY